MIYNHTYISIYVDTYLHTYIGGRPLTTSRYFEQFLTPLPLSHFVTHLGNPLKYVILWTHLK